MPAHTPASEPASFTKSTLMAVRAFRNGAATEGQQRAVWEWITLHACMLLSSSYEPGGEDGSRASAFAEGRRFVAIQLVALCKPEAVDWTEEAKAEAALKAKMADRIRAAKAAKRKTRQEAT